MATFPGAAVIYKYCLMILTVFTLVKGKDPRTNSVFVDFIFVFQSVCQSVCPSYEDVVSAAGAEVGSFQCK